MVPATASIVASASDRASHDMTPVLHDATQVDAGHACEKTESETLSEA